MEIKKSFFRPYRGLFLLTVVRTTTITIYIFNFID